MKVLDIAIYGKFAPAGTKPTLYTALSGKLYPGKAPEGTILPYGIFVSSELPEYTFTSILEDVTVHFDLYHLEHDGVRDLYDNLKALYDNCTLSVTGYNFLKFERMSADMIPDEFYYRQMVEYRVWLHKNT